VATRPVPKLLWSVLLNVCVYCPALLIVEPKTELNFQLPEFIRSTMLMEIFCYSLHTVHSAYCTLYFYSRLEEKFIPGFLGPRALEIIVKYYVTV